MARHTEGGQVVHWFGGRQFGRVSGLPMSMAASAAVRKRQKRYPNSMKSCFKAASVSRMATLKKKSADGAAVPAQQNKDPLFYLEGAWEAARKYEDRVLMAECNKILSGQRDRTAYIFRKLDRSGDGSLSRWEFMKGLQALHIPLSGERLRKFVDIFDQDGDGTVDYVEFADYVKNCGGPRASPPPLPLNLPIPQIVLLAEGKPNKWFFWSQKQGLIKQKNADNVAWPNILEDFDKEAMKMTADYPHDKGAGWQNYAVLKWQTSKMDVKSDIISRDDFVEFMKPENFDDRKRYFCIQSYVAANTAAFPGKNCCHRVVYMKDAIPKISHYIHYVRTHPDKTARGEFTRVHYEERSTNVAVNSLLSRYITLAVHFIQRELDIEIHRLGLDFIVQDVTRNEFSPLRLLQATGMTYEDGAPSYEQGGDKNAQVVLGNEIDFVENMKALTLPKELVDQPLEEYASPDWCRGDFCVFLPPLLAKADLEVLQFLQMSRRKQLMSENGSYVQTKLITRVRKHALILEACHGQPEEFGLFCHNTRPNKRIDNGRVNTFEMTIAHLRGTILEPGIVVFAQFKGFISNSISISIMSPGGDSCRADPTNYLKIGSNLQFECHVPLGASQAIHGSWLLSVADTEATDTGSMLEMWGIKAIVRRQKPNVAKSKISDSITEPTTSQLNSRNVYPPLVVKFQPVCDRCYKVYKRLETEMGDYDAQQRKMRLKGVEEARKSKSKEIHVPNFRHSSDPLSIDIESFLPTEEPQEDNLFETGASKFGISAKRYRHILAMSVATDRGKPASPPKISNDRPSSRHNNFESRMARLLVRSPQTRSNITAKLSIHGNTDSPSHDASASSATSPAGRMNFAAGKDKSVSAIVQQHDDPESPQGRLQSWSDRRQDGPGMSEAAKSMNVGSTAGHRQSILLPSKGPQKNSDVDRAIGLPSDAISGLPKSPLLPPLSTEQQSREKLASKAPLLSVGAALERKLAGDTIEPELLSFSAEAVQKHELVATVSAGGKKHTAAFAISSTSASSRDRQPVIQESSSFSFQKAFEETASVEPLVPSLTTSDALDQPTVSSTSYKLTAADVSAATSIVDLTKRRSDFSDFNSVNPVEAEEPKLSYEANAFLTNLKFAITDEARFLQELGSSRTKVIAERRKKIEQLVMHSHSVFFFSSDSSFVYVFHS